MQEIKNEKQIPSEQLALKKELLEQTDRVGSKSTAHKILILHPEFLGIDRTLLYQWPNRLEDTIWKPKTLIKIKRAIEILSKATDSDIKQVQQRRAVVKVEIPDQNVFPLVKIVARLDLEHLAISDLIFLLKTQDRIKVKMTADLISALLSAQRSEQQQT